MRTVDHLRIGKSLKGYRYHEVPIKFAEYMAFCAGNMAPDLNVITHLSFNESIGVGGHNYNAAMRKVKNKLGVLESSSKFKDDEFFLAGEILHYIVDIFTYAHNNEFDGNFKDHKSYERKLHENFSITEAAPRCYERKDIFHEITTLHYEYLKNIGDIENDKKYIWMIREKFINYMLQLRRYIIAEQPGDSGIRFGACRYKQREL